MVILDNIVNFRPDWVTGNPIENKNKQTKSWKRRRTRRKEGEEEEWRGKNIPRAFHISHPTPPYPTPIP